MTRTISGDILETASLPVVTALALLIGLLGWLLVGYRQHATASRDGER